jgi:hypothetical protein
VRRVRTAREARTPYLVAADHGARVDNDHSKATEYRPVHFRLRMSAWPRRLPPCLAPAA